MVQIPVNQQRSVFASFRYGRLLPRWGGGVVGCVRRVNRELPVKPVQSAC
jgi:hypothetical protein